MIKKAQAEAQDIVAKGKEAGNNLKDEIERKAKEKSDELLEKSNKQIEAAKAKAIDEIKSVSVDLAIQAASKVINKNLDDSTNRDLAKSTINEAN
jgi:F-type H+-transporting ATPase subunit b